MRGFRLLLLCVSSLASAGQWDRIATTGPEPRITMGAWDSRRSGLIISGGLDAENRYTDTWFFDGTRWTQTLSYAASMTSVIYGAALYNPGINAYSGTFYQFGGLRVGPPSLVEPNGEGYLMFPAIGVWNSGPSSRLVARLGHSLTWDPERQTAVLYGGQFRETGRADVFLGDVWEWGDQWMTWERKPDPPPSVGARAYHSACWSEALGAVVVFGGQGATAGAKNDAWTYDGTSWRRGPLATASLTPRTYPYMAAFSLPSRGSVVVFGGAPYVGGSYSDETFEWTPGSGWKKQAVTEHPPAVVGGVMVGGSAGEILMFGGCAAFLSQCQNTLWRYR